MRKLRVLHILNTASYSGAENVVVSIIDNERKEIEGIYVSRDGSIREVLEENNIQFYPLDKLNILNLKKILLETNPDIIHAHDFRAGIVAACSTTKIPIINHLHNNTPWLKSINWKSVIFGVFSARYRKILTVSDSVMGEYILGRTLAKKTQVIGNPIELNKVRQKANESHENCFYDIAFLGRLTEQKDPLFFLDIIYELRKENPDLKVAIIGDGELRVDIEKRLVELQLNDAVTLYGFLSNPYPVLKTTKVLCMPSKWEGFGLAAVEALILGKPVFASPVGGLVNIINSECGELCDTLQNYVSALERILHDEKYYNEKVHNALKRAKELENMDLYMDTLKKIYTEITKNGESK